MTPERLRAYRALSSAASRFSDLRRAAYRGWPGSPAAVAYGDMHATMADLRTAYTLACGGGVGPDDIQTCGILTVEATRRLRGRR